MDLLQPVRGTADLLPEDKANIATLSPLPGCNPPIWIQNMAACFEFTGVQPPLGPSSDVVVETYSFEDRGGIRSPYDLKVQLQLHGRSFQTG